MNSDTGYRSAAGICRGVDPAIALDFPDAALTRALRVFVGSRLRGQHAHGDDLVQETFVCLLGYQERESTSPTRQSSSSPISKPTASW